MIKDVLPYLRTQKNISQTALADALGVSRQAVAKWEMGHAQPDIDKIIALSDYFQISIDRLVRREGDCGLGVRQTGICVGEDIIDFLLRAKKATYAANGAHAKPCRPGSHDLHYTEEDFAYIDTYLGGAMFGGEEAVWQQGQPKWCMNYMGRVISDYFKGDFLKNALMNVPKQSPYRGPDIYREGDYSYHCVVQGTFHWFQGFEEIFCGEIKTYECYFHGGSVSESR